MLIIYFAILFTDNSFNLRTHLLQQRQRRFQPGGRIVIASHNNQLQSRILSRHPVNETIEHPLGSSRRIGNIKDISGNNQYINLVLSEDTGQPVQKMFVFLRAVIPEKGLSQMPIGCM